MFLKSRKLFIIVTLSVALGATGGCTEISATGTSLLALVLSVFVSGTKDVTALDTFQGQNIWKSYKRDGVYQLKRDLLYGKVFDPGRDEYELFPPWAEQGTHGNKQHPEWDSKTGTAVQGTPMSFKEFHADPTKWGKRIKGVVSKGTKLKMERVIFEQNLNTHDFYYIGVFLDGPFVGKRVLLNVISMPEGIGVARAYDSDYLEQVR